MSQQYPNELTPELAASLARPPFSAEKKAAMSDGARQTLEEQEAFLREHPVVSIYRIAVDGALTQRDGVVHAAWNGAEIELDGGQKVNIALVGDEVVYPDGTTARIVTGSGSKFQKGGQSIALVGSRLSNGDVIISTPQAGCTLNELTGLPIDTDFLPAEG
ncbi:PAAR domain-containing protein [Enterobacter ludwigii]|nr:PAAR domain-containing protein [Enterobacter ludwigii]